jgi:hypothetical protein
MKTQPEVNSVSRERASCPYCHAQTAITLPPDFAPVFVFCDVCKTKFIAVRHAGSFEVMTEEDAPCYRNPDCIELELGGSDEE